MDPESVGTLAERDLGAHREHIGVYRHREQDRREDREHFHREIELVGEEGIVCRFERFDSFLLAFEEVPEADVGADQILEIDLGFERDERVILLDDGLEDRALGLQRAAEIEDVALQDRYLEHHLLLFLREDLGLDIIQLLIDVIQARKTGIEEYLDEAVEEVRRCGREREPALALAFFQILEKLGELIDALPMARDEVVARQDDIEFARIRRPVFHVEEGNMDGKEQAVVILHDLGLIGGRDELLYRERMDIEILLQIGDIIAPRILKIDPRYLFVFDYFHFSASVKNSFGLNAAFFVYSSQIIT